MKNISKRVIAGCLAGAVLTGSSVWLYLSATPNNPIPPISGMIDVFTSSPQVNIEIEAKYSISYSGVGKCCMAIAFPYPGSPDITLSVENIPTTGVDVRIALSNVANIQLLGATDASGKVLTIDRDAEYQYIDEDDRETSLAAGQVVALHMPYSPQASQAEFIGEWVEPPYNESGAQIAASFPFISTLRLPSTGIQFSSPTLPDDLAGKWFNPAKLSSTTEAGTLHSDQTIDYVEPTLTNGNHVLWSGDAPVMAYVITNRREAASISNRLFWASGLFGVGLPVLGASVLGLRSTGSEGNPVASPSLDSGNQRRTGSPRRRGKKKR